MTNKHSHDLQADSIETAVKDACKEMSGEIDRLEKKIKDNPLQSVGIAFVSGLVLSYLLKRR